MRFCGWQSVAATVGLSTALIVSTCSWGQSSNGSGPSGSRTTQDTRATKQRGEEEIPLSVVEARGRAKLLHETYEATLLTIHRQYFHEGKGMPVPSRALEDIFHRVARRSNVEARWIAVNAQAMSIEHNPKDDFEKAAVRALDAGHESYELLQRGTYRRAAAVTLVSDCIKCHTSQTRAPIAGLVITMRVAMN
mgnify:FL=1